MQNICFHHSLNWSDGTEPGIYQSFTPTADACGSLLNLFIPRPCQMSDKDWLIEMNTSELPTDATNVQGMPFQLTCFGPFWFRFLLVSCGEETVSKNVAWNPCRAAGFDFLGLIMPRRRKAGGLRGVRYIMNEISVRNYRKLIYRYFSGY